VAALLSNECFQGGFQIISATSPSLVSVCLEHTFDLALTTPFFSSSLFSLFWRLALQIFKATPQFVLPSDLVHVLLVFNFYH